MALTMARAAYSPIVRELLDFTTALLTPDGEVMAQGRTNALHLGSIMGALQGIRARFGDDMHPGDIFVNNDPYEGGSHLPDVFILKPLFVEGRLVAFAGAEAHVSDIGGRVPGSNAADSTEIFQEGLRIPPSRLATRGVPNETLWDLIAPERPAADRVVGDLRAILAAVSAGERGFFRLVGSTATTLPLLRRRDHELHRAVARAEIGGWPDGEYVFEDAIDDDGLDPARSRSGSRSRCAATRWRSTSRAPRRRPGRRSTRPVTFTRAACFLAVRAAMTTHLPHNSGFTRPLRIVVPEGTILNPRSPAAVAARALAAYRTTNVVVGRAGPDRPGANDGRATRAATRSSRWPAPARTGGPGCSATSTSGAWGGRHDRDGVDGLCGVCVSTANTPCEIIELEYPLRIEQYGYVQDACGAGRFRGGLGLVRDYRVLEDRTMIQVRSDRVTTRAYGLYGGEPGTPGRTS